MRAAQLHCLGEGQRNMFIHHHLDCAQVCSLQRAVEHLKKNNTWEHLLCDGTDDSNLPVLYVCQLRVIGGCVILLHPLFVLAKK